MNSGNSGSMQSSSGGEDEYDSRDELISSFINPSSQVCPTPFTQQYNHPPSIFDPPNVHLGPFKQTTPPANSNPLLNFDLVSSRVLASQPNCTAVVGQASPSASSQPILGARGSNLVHFQTPSLVSENEQASTSSQQKKAVRHSKKRSRASRRAPTTVLTTNTANFRAMVQEYTGSPAPPFSASSISRSRFDLFNTISAPRSSNYEQLPSPYPLRPSAQRIQIPSIESSSFSSLAMVDSVFKLQETKGFGTSHGNATANAYYSERPNLALSDKAIQMRKNNSLSSGVGMELNDWDQVPLQSCHENYGDSQMVSNSKKNYTTSSRGEGMVDSWICSSD